MVNSHMAYNISVYGATTKQNLDKILLQQKKALKIMFKLKQRESVKPYFPQLGILTVYSLYVYKTVLFVKKNSPLLNFNCHDYNTRQNRHVDRHRLKFYEKKTSFIGTKFLFNLPSNIKNEENYDKF